MKSRAEVGPGPFVILVALLGAASCGPSIDATMSTDRYTHDRYGYEVLSTVHDEFLPAGPGWKVDNLHFIKRPSGKIKIESKKGADYVVEYFLDYDNDGEAERLGKFYAYDLRLVNARDAGVIWLRTLPLHRDDAQRDLRVLAEQYVAGIAGTYYETAQLEGALYRTNQEKAYATTINSRAMGTVAGYPAYSVILDVADVHQLELDPNARRQRVILLLIRTPFRYEHNKKVHLPVLMLVGYSNLVADFPRGFPSFQQFVSRIAIGGRTGSKLETIRQAPPAAQPAPPQPIPPAGPVQAAPPSAPDAGAPAAPPEAPPITAL